MPPTTIKRTVKLHPAQAAFRHSPALYRALAGGRGSGKTWCGAYDMMVRARPDRTYLVGSPTGVLLNDTTFPTFKAIASDLGLWDNQRIKLTPYPNATLRTGATIRFRTAEDPDKLRGTNLSGVWLDEASLMEESAYLVAIGSLRESGTQGWLSATYTPKGKSHWTYPTFATGRPDTAHFGTRTRDNPFLPPDFAATLARQYGGLLALQELEGLYVTLEGAEWPPEYFDSSIWFDDFPPDFELVARAAGLDPSKGRDAKSGDYAAFALLAISHDGTLWCEADLFRGRSAEYLADMAIEHTRAFSPDALAVEVNQFQQLFASVIDLKSRSAGVLVPVVEVNNTVPKIVRIRRLGPYLAQRRIRFRRTPGTELLVQQLQEFPQGKFDDGPDALEMALRALGNLLDGSGEEDADVTILST